MTVGAECRAAFIDALELSDIKWSEGENDSLRISWGASPVDFKQIVTFRELSEGLERISVHLIPSMLVQRTRREATAVFLGCVNYDIAVGNWEIDETDGQVLFRLSFVTDRPVSPIVADYYLSLSRRSQNRVMPHLMRLVNDGFSAEEAYLDYEAELDAPAPESDDEGDPEDE